MSHDSTKTSVTIHTWGCIFDSLDTISQLNDNSIRSETRSMLTLTGLRWLTTDLTFLYRLLSHQRECLTWCDDHSNSVIRLKRIGRCVLHCFGGQDSTGQLYHSASIFPITCLMLLLPVLFSAKNSYVRRVGQHTRCLSEKESRKITRVYHYKLHRILSISRISGLNNTHDNYFHTTNLPTVDAIIMNNQYHTHR